MSKTDRKRWQRTSPLAAIFYLGKIYKTIAQNAVQSLAPVAAVLFTSKGDLTGRIIFVAIAFVGITVTLAILRYWFFRYRIEGNSILIRDGILNKTQLDIKFERIQAINTQQNIVYRLFDLVTVQFDTAGSSKQEGHLPAISVSTADALRKHIRGRQPAGTLPADDAGALPVESHTLVRLGSADMLRIGLSSNRALIFLVLLGPLFEQLGDRIEQTIDESTLVNSFNSAGGSLIVGVTILVAMLLMFMIFLALVSIIGAFIRYHRFELCSENDVLRSVGGLLTRHEQSVNLAKIQSLRAVQNPVLRWFRRYRVRASQASSGRPGRGRQFIVPICQPDQLAILGEKVFGDEFPDVDLQPSSPMFQPIARHFIRSRLLLFGVLPSVLAVLVYYVSLGLASLVFLVWIPACALAAWTYYRKYGFAIASNGMMLRRGFFGYQTSAFLYRKVQRISVTQTVPQARKGLATIKFFLASGSLTLPYVDYQMAGKLRDFILYKVESSRRAWH